MVDGMQGLLVTLLGFSVFAIFGCNRSHWVVTAPGSRVLNLVAVLALAAAILVFQMRGLWQPLVAASGFVYHIVLLRLLYRAFLRKFGRAPRSLVFPEWTKENAVDRAYSALFFMLGTVGYIGIGVAVKIWLVAWWS
jgi:hypothetical protein